MLVTGIRLENVRVFEGDHLIPIDKRLTVLIGRNNAGKSTVLRAAFLLVRDKDVAARIPKEAFWRAGAESVAVGLRLDLTTQQCAAALGGDLSLDEITAEEPRTGRKLAVMRMPGFRQWPAQPRIELGHRWLPSATPTLRLGARDSSQFIELHRSGRGVVMHNNMAMHTDLSIGRFPNAAKAAPADESFGDAGPLVAYWEHHCVKGSTDWIVQTGRRLRDTDEPRLQEVLTFLRMKHSREFEHVSRAVRAAFPEFGGLDFIDVKSSGFDYRPGFVTAVGGGDPLAREHVGSGAWAYLCILTAARAAKATGARILFLDEPHLYMHPGLERLLLDELLDPALWDGEPLQIVAATHSPTFVNHAVEHGTLNILDWKDESRRSAHVQTIRHDDDNARRLEHLLAEPGDILYAERVIFVEGPSDVAALRILARKRCEVRRSIRFVPLRQTDAVAPDIAKFFSVVVQAGGAGAHTKAILLLDGDKKATLEKAWDKLSGTDDPRKIPGLDVVWSNPLGNDLESLFCDLAFLVAYFVHRGIDEAIARHEIKDALARIAPSGSRLEKGCTAIRDLHAKLLGENDASESKADDLENLVRFYLANIDDVVTATVRVALKPIEDALRKLDGQQLTS